MPLGSRINADDFDAEFGLIPDIGSGAQASL